METLTDNPALEYANVRSRSEAICKPLLTEDYVVQPVADVSPPKWHLGHTTWFFERFLLRDFLPGYRVYDPQYEYVFNSYYESIGARVIRTDRGNLTRPSVDDVYQYRSHVDTAMAELGNLPMEGRAREIFELGLNHEQQHQELLLTDIKYILGHNPLFPPYDTENSIELSHAPTATAIAIDEGIYAIGHSGDGFCFDNELGRHRVFLEPYTIQSELVTNREYLEFVTSGGYRDFRFWLAEGWDWVKSTAATAPMYWHHIEGNWHQYTLGGLKPLPLEAPVSHVNYYEASAFAAWKGKRLPTEFEWEAASAHFNWGQRWEWTASAYLPYPGFSTAPGALGEYNGKFMVNQMVLRGGSIATPHGHTRNTYRNFFHPHLRWQFTGIRLAG